jgi:4-hydroxybenzoate polyprenyltransferase
MNGVIKPAKKIIFWADISYRMLRIRTVIIMILFEAIGYEVAGPTKNLPLDFLWAAIMLGALYTSATSFNDVADEEIDKINLPGDVSRPLVTTNVSAAQLKILAYAALATALIAAVLVSPWYIFLVAGGAALNIFYSLGPLKLSHRGILASLCLSLSYVALPFFAGHFIQGKLTSQSWYLLLSMYLCFVGRVLLKDFRDYKGDKKFGKLNFLVRHGAKKTCQASALFWLAGDLVFLAAFKDRFGLLSLLIQPIIVCILWGLYRLGSEKNYDKQLTDVLFIGRMGNCIALSLLATLTLSAYDYSITEQRLIVVLIYLFTAISGIYFWFNAEADVIKKPAHTG